MSYSNPSQTVSSPANVYFKLNSKEQTNQMHLKIKTEDGAPDIPGFAVTSLAFAVLDEGFMSVGGQSAKNSGRFLTSNTVHKNGRQILKVFDQYKDANGNQKLGDHIATDLWRNLKGKYGCKNVKHVFALLMNAEGPDSAGLQALKTMIAEKKAIIKIDIKGKWYEARNNFNKRLKISNWDRMYIMFSQPLVAYPHNFGTAWLPTIKGRKVDPEKYPGDVAVDQACMELDAGAINEYREYICNKIVTNSSVEEAQEASPSDLANDVGMAGNDFDPNFQPTQERAAEISGEPSMDDLPF